jgi:hypothetical protein
VPSRGFELLLSSYKQEMRAPPGSLACMVPAGKVRSSVVATGVSWSFSARAPDMTAPCSPLIVMLLSAGPSASSCRPHKSKAYESKSRE